METSIIKQAQVVEAIEELLRKRREIAGPEGLLALGEAGHGAASARGERAVAGPRRDEGAGREVVAGEVATELEQDGDRYDVRVQLPPELRLATDPALG